MGPEEIFSAVKGKFGDVERASFPEKYVYGEELQLRVPKEKLSPVIRFIKEDPSLSFGFLDYMTAVDWVRENRFELLYHLTSLEFHHRITLRVNITREGAVDMPSITDLFAAADWQERETYDLYGIRFLGHPHLRRILLWEGYPGWPLRKDYVHITDKYDSGAEIGTPKAAPVEK